MKIERGPWQPAWTFDLSPGCRAILLSTAALRAAAGNMLANQHALLVSVLIVKHRPLTGMLHLERSCNNTLFIVVVNLSCFLSHRTDNKKARRFSPSGPCGLCGEPVKSRLHYAHTRHPAHSMNSPTPASGGCLLSGSRMRTPWPTWRSARDGWIAGRSWRRRRKKWVCLYR